MDCRRVIWKRAFFSDRGRNAPGTASTVTRREHCGQGIAPNGVRLDGYRSEGLPACHMEASVLQRSRAKCPRNGVDGHTSRALWARYCTEWGPVRWIQIGRTAGVSYGSERSSAIEGEMPPERRRRSHVASIVGKVLHRMGSG